jgi:hypothetical protein
MDSITQLHSRTAQRAIPTMYLFSAKGAAFINSLGQRPRVLQEIKSAALKARFLQGIDVELKAKRLIESRFQRWFTSRSESWGDAPGWHEGALLALETTTMAGTPPRCGVRAKRKCP